ncbi:MAG: phosphopantetheine adenylyltransferase [Acidobacteria bacterium]|nr:phosphopantetheine adenylyltransferase [Acidobacteriota bacterium]
MRNWFVGAVLAIAGVIHVIPLVGVAGAGSLERLYGVTIVDPNLELLMRHRAILLGMLGAVFLVAALRASWRPAVVVVALVSTASFVLLGWMVAGRNADVDRVVLVDLVVAALLAGASVVQFWPGRAISQGRKQSGRIDS